MGIRWSAYAYDDADEMTAAAGVSYGYDANGNQTSRGSDSFAWNHENRLTSLTISGATSSYTYNGDGLRNSRTTGGSTSYYTWSWGSGLPLVLNGGAQSYVYGLGLLMTTNGTAPTAYFMTDGLGSVANVTDASGNAVVSYTYDAFGGIRTQTGSSSNYWGFAGEERDNESGYYYLRERYYDPVVGRFLGQDPLGHGYPYASNNPANLTDPSGLAETCGNGGDPADGSYYEFCYETLSDELTYFAAGDIVILRFEGEGIGHLVPGFDETQADLLFTLTVVVNIESADTLSAQAYYNTRNLFLRALGLSGIVTGGIPDSLEWWLNEDQSFVYKESPGSAWVVSEFETDNFGGNKILLGVNVTIGNGVFDCSVGVYSSSTFGQAGLVHVTQTGGPDCFNFH